MRECVCVRVSGDLCTSKVLKVRMDRRSQNFTTPRTDPVMTCSCKELQSSAVQYSTVQCNTIQWERGREIERVCVRGSGRVWESESESETQRNQLYESIKCADPYLPTSGTPSARK